MEYLKVVSGSIMIHNIHKRYPQISSLASFILYADDANIILTGDSICDVKQKLNDISIELTRWVESNGLSLNLKKENTWYSRKIQPLSTSQTETADITQFLQSHINYFS